MKQRELADILRTTPGVVKVSVYGVFHEDGIRIWLADGRTVVLKIVGR